MKIIKKYKNRRLYDTELSQYITLDQLQKYVLDKVPFQVIDIQNKIDITNSILLQILVEIEAGTSQFLSSEILRQIICLANHPMQASLKTMMEEMFQVMQQPLQTNPYAQAAEAWSDQMHKMMQYWHESTKK